jgi:tRNA A-37 threonylcarbamoyl transferase component Bud32
MTAAKQKKPVIDSFDFLPGRMLAGKYEVLACLGKGWEGEVYHVIESRTGIERAVKFFYPQRNVRDKAVSFYAKKLHKLRHCPILIQYHTQDTIRYRQQEVTFLVSEYVEGELLSSFIERQHGKRLSAFQAIHLLHALVSGIENIHGLGEYHGDLHTDNVILMRYGLGFELKLIDMYHWGAPRRENIQEDICDMVRIFYDAVGGKKYYAKQHRVVKEICCGLKRQLILKKFRSAADLREHLETLEW